MARKIDLNEHELLCKLFYDNGIDFEPLIEGGNIVENPILRNLTEGIGDFRNDDMTDLMRVVGTLSEDYLIPPKADIHILRLPRYMPVTNHGHDFIEMIYVYSGECDQIIDGKPFEAKEGDLFVLAPGVFHQTRAYNYDSIVFHIMVRRSTFQKSFIALLKGSDILADFFARTIYGKHAESYLIFRIGYDELLSDWIFRMYEEATGNEDFSDRMLNTQFEWLCLHLLRHHISNVDIYGKGDDVITAELLWYIHDNIEHISLTTMAKEFGYSTGYLCRLVQKYTGSKFTELTTKVRVDKASELLENSDIEIGKIANAVGFCDTSNFYRAFRKHRGITPARYRKEKTDRSLG